MKKYHSYIFKMFRKIYYSTGIGKCQDLSNGLFVYKLFVRFCLPIRLAAFDVFITIYVGEICDLPWAFAEYLYDSLAELFPFFNKNFEILSIKSKFLTPSAFPLQADRQGSQRPMPR